MWGPTGTGSLFPFTLKTYNSRHITHTPVTYKTSLMTLQSSASSHMRTAGSTESWHSPFWTGASRTASRSMTGKTKEPVALASPPDTGEHQENGHWNSDMGIVQGALLFLLSENPYLFCLIPEDACCVVTHRWTQSEITWNDLCFYVSRSCHLDWLSRAWQSLEHVAPVLAVKGHWLLVLQVECDVSVTDSFN